MPEISIKAEELFRIGSFPVTNSLFLALFTSILFIIVGVVLKRRLKLIPGKFQGMIEIIFEELLSLMDAVLGEREKSIKYFPLIATIFLFVMVSNWMGLLPFTGPIGVSHTVTGPHGEHEALIPLFRAPSADLNFTIALAIIAVFAVNILGIFAVSFKTHFSKFFTLKTPILSFVGILEFISEFVKIISFSFRLFGNVFAGEVLLIIIGFLLPYVAPLPFLALEIFVGFIQAFIFSMLTLVFVAMATTHETGH